MPLCLQFWSRIGTVGSDQVVFNIGFAICGHRVEVYDVRGLNTKVPASAVGVVDGQSLFL